MPKLVHSSQLTVDRNATTVNRKLKTVNCRHRRLGFTLIELLVVITIISTLVSIGTFAFNNALDKGRDTRRKSDLAAVKSALTLYYEDNDKYPPKDPLDTRTVFPSDAADDPWIPDIGPYIKQLPKDPRQALNIFTGLASLLKPKLHLTQPQVARAACSPTLTDAPSSVAGNARNRLNWSHTYSGSSTDGLLIVGVAIRNTTSQTVGSLTYNGIPLTKVGEINQGGGTVRVEMWSLANPPLGTYNISLNISPSHLTYFVAGATSWTGIQGDFFSNQGAVSNPTVNITSGADEVVVDSLSVADANGTNTATAPADQTVQWNLSANNGSTGVRGASSTKPGATTVMSWTVPFYSAWALGAISIKPPTSCVSPPVASPPVASPPVASPPVASPPVASPPVASPPVISGDCSNAPIYCYKVPADRNSYILWAKLDNANDPETFDKASATCTDSSPPAGFNYCLKSE